MEELTYAEREQKRIKEEREREEAENKKKAESLKKAAAYTTIGTKYKSRVHREGIKKQSVLARDFFLDRGSEQTREGQESKGIPIPERFDPVLKYVSEFVEMGVKNGNIEEISKPDYYKTHALTQQEMEFLDKITPPEKRLLLKAAGFFENVALQNCIYKYYIVKALALPETEDIEKKLAIEIAGLTLDEYTAKIKQDKASVATTGKRTNE